MKPSRTTLPRHGSRPASLPGERAAVLAALQPVVALLGRMVGPHVEVVLHDLTQPEHSVVAIANGHLSGREPGSSILSGPQDDIAFAAALRETHTRGGASHTVIDGYPTLTRDGKRLHSATVIFRDGTGLPYAALCVNADLRLLRQVRQWLDAYLPIAPGSSAPLPDALGPFDGEDQQAPSPARPARTPRPRAGPARPSVQDTNTIVHEVVREALRHSGKPVAELDRGERQAIVQTLLHRGLFVIRGGVEQAARALGVSRYTIYNDAKALRAATGLRDERHR